jgi:hypothetical protein
MAATLCSRPTITAIRFRGNLLPHGEPLRLPLELGKRSDRMHDATRGRCNRMMPFGVSTEHVTERHLLLLNNCGHCPRKKRAEETARVLAFLPPATERSGAVVGFAPIVLKNSAMVSGR